MALLLRQEGKTGATVRRRVTSQMKESCGASGCVLHPTRPSSKQVCVQCVFRPYLPGSFGLASTDVAVTSSLCVPRKQRNSQQSRGQLFGQSNAATPPCRKNTHNGIERGTLRTRHAHGNKTNELTLLLLRLCYWIGKIISSFLEQHFFSQFAQLAVAPNPPAVQVAPPAAQLPPPDVLVCPRRRLLCLLPAPYGPVPLEAQQALRQAR